jgi:hypothetical protein
MFVFLQPACQYANEADRGGMACSSLQGLRHIQDLTARNFCFREAPTGTPPVTMADNNWLQHAPGGSAQCTDTGITPRLEVRNIRNIRRHDSWSTEQLTAAIRAIHGGGGQQFVLQPDITRSLHPHFRITCTVQLWAEKREGRMFLA